MARENSMRPGYEILAYITMKKDRVIAGNPLCLVAEDAEELKATTLDIAKAMKGDIVHLKNNDYMVVRA